MNWVYILVSGFGLGFLCWIMGAYFAYLGGSSAGRNRSNF